MDDDNDAVSSLSQPKKASLFLSCFGFSGKPKEYSTKIHHRSRFFRRSTFLLKQSAAGTKTVPLDSTASDKIQHKKIISMFKKAKVIKKNAAGDIPLIKPQFTPAPVKPLLETKPNLEKKVLTENAKLSDNKKSRTDQPDKLLKKVDPILRNNELFRKRINSIRNASSQPGSPDTNSRRTNMVPRSTSFPAKTPMGNLTRKTQPAPKKPRANKFDAMMGMSIIMMTLVIILIWGRLCAIICTCTWLYFVPRLRKNNGNGDVEVNPKPGRTDQNGLVSDEPDFNSEEYEKKRVVLEGFLVRNHNMNRSAV